MSILLQFAKNTAFIAGIGVFVFSALALVILMGSAFMLGNIGAGVLYSVLLTVLVGGAVTIVERTS